MYGAYADRLRWFRPGQARKLITPTLCARVRKTRDFSARLDSRPSLGSYPLTFGLATTFRHKTISPHT